jgi:RNA polymerase sigma-70 factor, ECF subfamily
MEAPAGDAAPDAASAFDPLRPRLTRIAYRMLGQVADAEDIVQEAFIRWQRADRAQIAEPAAYLRRVVTRLCLDHLKSARVRRETYIGPWLPEPIVETGEEAIDDITLPLMMALERLSPLERAAFLLHDVFGVGFEEIALTLGRAPAAVRQLAARARQNVRQARPRFDLPKARGFEIAEAFYAASRSGDVAALSRLLAADVAIYSDGGGKRPAALIPVLGIERALKLILRLAERNKTFAPPATYRLIDGLPGFITREGDGVLQTTALQIEDGRIKGIYVMRNPDKLVHLEREALH